MYDTILIPTDGSREVATAVEKGIDLARTYEATLHALHVVGTPSVSAEFGGSIVGVTDVIGELEEEGVRATDVIAERAARAGIETETTIRRGAPRREILAYVRANDVDLIVMGTHGRTGVDRMLLGSVAEHVVRHADVPVLTVPIK